MAKRKRVFNTAFNEYKEIRVIGEGGAGYVLEAIDLDECVYAIKILNAQDGPRSKLKRFQNEINFCQNDIHRNIVRVVDYGNYVEDAVNTPFYVMRKYDCTLRDLVSGGIAPNNVMRLFGLMLDGIEAAHLFGVVHRDLKPENVLCSADGTELVVSDFGVSHFTPETLIVAVETDDRERLANFQYSAPEQRTRGKTIDLRADIYALGLMLNEMFTRSVPLGTNYKTITQVAPDYQYLDEIVAGMISQSPDDRYGSIADLKSALVAREQRFVAWQKLNESKQKVIQETDLDDPVLRDPIRIIGVDWDNGRLSIELNQSVNPQWINAMQHMGSFEAVAGKGPERFQLHGSTASVDCRPNDAQRVIDYFKTWLPKTHQVYERHLRTERERDLEQRRRRLRQEIQAREERKRVLDNLQI